MNNILKVAKYQIYDSRKAVAIFYSIIFLIFSIGVISFNYIGSDSRFGGFGMASAIFIFICGLNSFKTDFKFMLANNVSRRKFYYGNIAGLLTIALLMALVDSILSIVMGLFMPYESAFLQFYSQKSILSEILWSFGIYGFMVFLGWFITMLYYRCNTTMKIIVSVFPIAITILTQYIDSQLQLSIGEKFIDLFDNLLGITSNNPYIAVLSFSIISIIVLAFSFLLIRRAPIKE